MQVYRAPAPAPYYERMVVWKRDGRLQALDFGGYETRHDSVLRLVALADARHGLPDFRPVLVNSADQPMNAGDPSWAVLSFSTAEGFRDVAVPDFLFDGWPQVGLGDYEDACAAACEAGAQPAELARAGWIGNCDTHPSRWALHRIGAEHADVLEVDHVEWVPNGSGPLGTRDGNQMTLAEQVRRWAVLLDVEGRGWSARLKLLLHSGRPVLVQERPWHEWFWASLRPMEHFIPVRRDLSDLVDRARWALEHPDEAAAIGRAGQAFARAHLTRERAARAWAETLRAVAAGPALACAPPEIQPALQPVLAQLGAVGPSRAAA